MDDGPCSLPEEKRLRLLIGAIMPRSPVRIPPSKQIAELLCGAYWCVRGGLSPRRRRGRPHPWSFFWGLGAEGLLNTSFPGRRSDPAFLPVFPVVVEDFVPLFRVLGIQFPRACESKT